jgi:septal ring factor EnvC (AmiA/AmiB activator)
MSAKYRRHKRLRFAAALGVPLCSGLLVAGSATGASDNQLQTKLNSTQSELNATQTHQKTLAGNISALNGQVSSLASQISLVQSRESKAQSQLSDYDTALSEAKSELATERAELDMLRQRLQRARKLLGAELRSEYEQPEESFVSLLVNANGFNQLLSQLQYMDSAKREEQAIIKLTQSARLKTQSAAVKIDKLEAADQQAANAAYTQTNALSGMNSLLASQQAALNDERAAQATALAASQSKGAQLQAAIKQIRQQEAAAQQATQTITPVSSSGGGTTTGGTTGTGGGGIGASDGWAIPYAIVLCESGGQNLPPNGAGASGYYQIIPDTWKLFGGSGPAAYLASKADQDAVAAKIWNGGAGASNWTCSSIVGTT